MHNERKRKCTVVVARMGPDCFELALSLYIHRDFACPRIVIVVVDVCEKSMEFTTEIWARFPGSLGGTPQAAAFMLWLAVPFTLPNPPIGLSATLPIALMEYQLVRTTHICYTEQCHLSYSRDLCIEQQFEPFHHGKYDCD